MPLQLRRRGRYSRQPQGAAPIARAFKPLAVFNAAAEIRNLGAGGQWTITTGGVSSANDVTGRALRFAGGANTGKCTASIPSVSGEITAVFVVANLNGASGGGTAGRVLSCFNGSTQAPLDIYVDGAGLVNVGRSFSTTGFTYKFPFGLGTTARPSVFVVWVPVTAGVAPRGWVDGVEQTMTLVAGPSVGTASSGNTTLTVGGRPDVTTRQLAGDVYFATVLPGGFPERLNTELSLKPWLVYELGAHGRTIPAASGSPYTLTAAAGTFTESGQAANLLAARTIAGAAGAFTETGQDAGLIAARTIAGAAGSFTETGQDAGLRATRTVAGAAGAFTLTGQDAALTYTPAGAYSMPAAAGSFSETGQDAGLLATRTLAGAAGSFSETGQDATLLHARLMAAAPGSFAFTGTDASLVYTPSGNVTMAAEAGSVAFTGQVADLQYSGATRLARARSAGRITQTASRPAATAGRRRT